MNYRFNVKQISGNIMHKTSMLFPDFDTKGNSFYLYFSFFFLQLLTPGLIVFQII